jgi:hypothetical protein
MTPRIVIVAFVVLALAGCATEVPTVELTSVSTSSPSEPGLVDSGVADAAGGTVDYDDGVLQSYTAAEGDHFDAIASRFGITMDALSALNPSIAVDALVAAGTVVALR